MRSSMASSDWSDALPIRRWFTSTRRSGSGEDQLRYGWSSDSTTVHSATSLVRSYAGIRFRLDNLQGEVRRLLWSCRSRASDADDQLNFEAGDDHIHLRPRLQPHVARQPDLAILNDSF